LRKVMKFVILCLLSLLVVVNGFENYGRTELIYMHEASPVRRLCGQDFYKTLSNICPIQREYARPLKICCKYNSAQVCRKITPPEGWDYICREQPMERIQQRCCSGGCSFFAVMKGCTSNGALFL